ncbi:MAG TPA: J domain-containing protein [Jiangellaceae bacterium]
MVRVARNDWSHRDYYAILEVPATASQDEINRAYRRRARATHPDLNTDDPRAEQQFDELAAAREVLTDPTSRAAYDELRNARTATSAEADHSAGTPTRKASESAPVVPAMPVLGRRHRSVPPGSTIRVGPVRWTPSEVRRP